LKEKHLTTKYAPAERATKEEIDCQVDMFKNNQVLEEFLSKIPAVFLIVNNGALEFTGLDDLSTAVGKRPGELIGCVHSTEEEGGCGTTGACTYCGAVNAVLSSQKGKPAVEDCRLLLGLNEEAYDLRVFASPLKFDGEEFTAVTIQDIRHEKRLAMLEQVFFHDILNTTSGLLGTLQLIQNHEDKIDEKELLKRANYLTKKLIEEIRSQRILHAAENNTLRMSPNAFKSVDFLNEIVELYTSNDIAKKNTIQIDANVDDVEITTDRTILRRIISNMVKNAIEATPEGGKITIGCEVVNAKAQFWVHNPGFIPQDVQMQIFQRSFSTKSPYRGLGTYSMKLLSAFLNGSVNFTTSEEDGTTFRAIYPLSRNS
jgi:signal transduction histidine kinase